MQRPQMVGWVLGSSLLALACARAAEPPPRQYYSPPFETVTNDVGQLERDLDQNEQVVQAQLGQAAPSGAPAEKSKGEQEAAAPSSAPAPVNADEKAPARSAAGAAPGAPTPCADACRAFGSMQRSAGRICELTSNDHERCTRARERVRTAETRLTQAGCVCPPRSD
jgi:hypothetical protein